MAQHPDRVFKHRPDNPSERVWQRSELIREVWGEGDVNDQRIVDVHIGQLRKKLEALRQDGDDLTNSVSPLPRPWNPKPSPIADGAEADP